MSKKKERGIGSVYYNKERNNWTASYKIIDIETKKEKRIRKKNKKKFSYRRRCKQIFENNPIPKGK